MRIQRLTGHLSSLEREPFDLAVAVRENLDRMADEFHRTDTAVATFLDPATG